jgi:hypothetical protein
MNKEYKVVKRQFLALRYPRGSPDRNKYNHKSITSEFARHKKWLVTRNKKPLLTFESLNDAYLFIADPDKEKYKSKIKFKKYTKDDFIKNITFWNNRKRTWR